MTANIPDDPWPESLSVLEEIDPACDRFEQAWRAGQNPRIEEYVEEASERARPGLLRALLRVEIACRLERHETILSSDYTRRFPRQAGLIESLLAVRQSTEQSGELTHAGRYRLEGLIASGGMGDVYRAHDPDFHRPLAVKVLRNEFKDRPDMVKRFLGEAKLTGQLQHPGVPPVHEIGTLSDGRPFMAMKLIKGRTLEALLPKRENPAERLQSYMTVFKQVCQTLAFAHSQGVIHRDLKPANIMVGAHGEVQVMDWGLAKSRRSGDRIGVPKPETSTTAQAHLNTVVGLTKPGAVMGSFVYMPPEQARGEVDRLDERSDVFSIGAILCVILTGQPPYRARSAEQLLQQAKNADLAEALAGLDTCGADEVLVTLAKACLATDMAKRPLDASAVVTVVTAYQAGLQERLHRFELEREAARVRTHEEKKRRRVTLVMAVAIAVIVVVMPVGALVSAIWWETARGEAQTELAGLKNERDEAVAELAGLKNERDEAVAELARSTDEIASLQQEIRKLYRAIVVPADPTSPAAPVQEASEQAAPAAPDRFQKEYDALQGTWVLVRGEGNFWWKGLRWIIEGKHIKADHTASKFEMPYKVDPGQRPKTIDFSFASTNLLAIYELEGQVLRICGVWGSPQQRPTEFKAEAGGPALLMVFRRFNDKERPLLKKAEDLQDLREQLSKIQKELNGERGFLREGIPNLSRWEYTPEQVSLNRMECTKRIAWLEEAEVQIERLLLDFELSRPLPKAPKPAPPPPSPEDQASGLLRVAKIFHDAGDSDRAKKKYKEIVNKFPETKAAEEARELLKKLGE
jgi:uncharacterized protein (TIGR03067 family)